jgi:hypothetical protein
MKKIIIAVLSFMCITASNADCVWAATAAYSYKILDNNTLVLVLGDDGNILIKSDSAYFFPGQQISVLKDAFCDYEQSVLRVDGQVIDVSTVKWLKKK